MAMGRCALLSSDVLPTKTQKKTIKALRTPEAIRAEMRKLSAPRPDHVRTAQDWLKIERFNELYAEWIESVTKKGSDESLSS